VEKPFHAAALETGLIRALVYTSQLAGASNEPARAVAFTALGNYILGSFEMVNMFERCGGLATMLAAIRSDGTKVRERGIFLLHVIVDTADDARRHLVQHRGHAEALLKGLIQGRKVLAIVEPFISPHDIETSATIIGLIYIALQWNKELVVKSLQDDDLESRLHAVMNACKDAAGVGLYKQICAIQDILQDSQSDMAIDAETIEYVDDGTPFNF
jgi:hypothetical protein